MPININSAPIYSMPSDPDSYIIEWIDKLMANVPAYTDFSIDSFNKPFDPIYPKLSIDIRKTLKSMNYIEVDGNRTKVRLSDKGREVKEAGGHFKYRQLLVEKENRNAEFFSDISAMGLELTKIGVSNTIMAEYLFNSQPKTQDSFIKFLADKSVDLSIALSTPAIADFLSKLR